nr:glycosyltransferase [Zobellia uliginosa]
MEALPSLTKKLNIKTISNPFNFDDINSRTGAIDKEYETKKFIVAAGRLAPAKGFDILIEAFKDIAVINNDLDLIILGEGAERNNLNKKIEELGLKERIHMPGYVKNVYAYFKRAEVCVLSSRIEGFPNVLLQMMSQNTAIVATLSAGGIEDIPNIQTCPTENTEKLKSSIINVLQSDTKANKPIFDSFLKSRTQSSFYAQIMESVK